MIDYDGFNQAPITNLHSTSLSPRGARGLVGRLHVVLQGVPTSSASTFNPRRRGQEPSSCRPGRAQHGSRLGADGR